MRKVSFSKLGFSHVMLLAIAAVVIGCVKVTVNLGESRKLPNDYSEIDSKIRQLQADIAEINQIQTLPKLESSWRTASAITVGAGIEFKVLEGDTQTQATNIYTGPLRNWTAQLNGRPRLVLAVAKKIQKQVPTFLYDYEISGGIMKLNITVVGT